jgi:hypothetical protein
MGVINHIYKHVLRDRISLNPIMENRDEILGRITAIRFKKEFYAEFL